MIEMRSCWVIALLLVTTAAACKSDPEPGGDSPSSGGSGGSGSGGTMRSGFGASLGDDLAKGSNGSGSAGAPSVASTPVGSAAPPLSNGSAGSAVVAVGSGAGSAKPPPLDHVPVKLTPELAAIKFELLPNWKRDVVEGGSFTLNVDPPSGGPTKQFTFYYAYDKADAPVDRDEYMKWLGDQSLLNVTLNRQRGAAWYLEGTDGGGPAFRYLVNYGGKHLICFGPLYKDPESSKLGDIRDEVVVQAKKICESIGL